MCAKMIGNSYRDFVLDQPHSMEGAGCEKEMSESVMTGAAVYRTSHSSRNASIIETCQSARVTSVI